MTTLTPPPLPPEAETPPAPETPGPRRSAPKVVAILTIALGGAVVLGTVLTAVFSTLSVSVRADHTASVDVSGVTELDIDADATDLTVRFDDVDEASLQVVNGAHGGWRLDVDGDTLHVETPRRAFFGWFAGGNGRATLTLPEELAGTDASLSLSAGSLTVDGTFGELDLTLSAGDLDVTGEARTVDLDVSAGSADLAIADVDEADFSLSAGDVTVRLTGEAPRDVSVDVSAGGLELTVPDVAYALRTDVSAGGLDTGSLRTDGSASRTIAVELSAGSVALRAG